MLAAAGLFINYDKLTANSMPRPSINFVFKITRSTRRIVLTRKVSYIILNILLVTRIS
jgi:hypothetical protein